MPYIKKEDRHKFEVKVEGAGITEGEMNYLITMICQYYLETHPKNYAAYNAVVGALECAKLELYRRLVVPYENDKISQNGDVF